MVDIRNKKYGVLLIGCGYIGYQHIEGIYDKENVTVIAVIDKNEETAKEFAERFGALHYGTDYRPYLDDPRVEIVIVATYTDTHFSITKESLEHGKHVICEKPIARSLEEAAEYVRMVKASPCKATVSYILRYNGSYRKIKELIDAGEIGDLRLFRFSQNHSTDKAHTWSRFLRLMEDCTPLVDCGVHYADVIRWFSGSEIVSVSGVSASLDPSTPVDNYQMMTLRLENGCSACYEVGWSRNMTTQLTKDFIGTKGHITLDLSYTRPEPTDKDLITVYRNDGSAPEYIEMDSVYKNMSAQFDNLVNMIETGAESVIPIDDVYAAFRAVITADRAIREHTILDPREF